MKLMYAESTIFYTDAEGVIRVRWSKGPFKTNAKSADTARPAYAKKQRNNTPPTIIMGAFSMRFLVLDPCDPCNRWILEHDGSEDTARILAECDKFNTAQGHAIPRASFLPPAR